MLTTLASSFPSSASSIFRRPKAMDYSVDINDNELFVDCMDKQVDVFDFLLERDDTSVSWEGDGDDSCWDDQCDGVSCCSNASTAYLDALEHEIDSEAEFEEGLSLDIDYVLECNDNMGRCAIEVELNENFELSRAFNDEEEDEQSLGEEERNPLFHAVHFAQNVWEGSKKTPVGLVVHVTEGIFGHVVGMIHQDRKEEDKKEKDQSLEERKDDVRSDEDVESIVPSAQPEPPQISPMDHNDPLARPDRQTVDEVKRRLELTTTMDPQVIRGAAFESVNGQCFSLASSADDTWLPLE